MNSRDSCGVSRSSETEMYILLGMIQEEVAAAADQGLAGGKAAHQSNQEG